MHRDRGFTLIELMIVIAIIAIIAAIAIPNLIEARKGANEAAAIGTMKTILSAQTIFRESDKDKNNLFDYATSLSALGTTNLVDGNLANGTKQGYVYSILSGADAWTFQATAVPITAGKSGDRSFFVDESGVIRFATSGTATSTDIPVGG